MNWSVTLCSVYPTYDSESDCTVVISCHLLHRLTSTVTIINTTDVTCSEGATNRSGAPEFIPGVRCVRVAYR